MTDYNKVFWGFANNGALRDLQEIYQVNKSVISTNWRHPEFNGATPLMRAAQFGHPKVVTWLLEKTDAKVNEKNLKGNTALMLAAYHGYEENVKILIQHGAEVNHQNKDLETALVYASTNVYDKVAFVLLKNGADPALKDYEDKAVFDKVKNRAKYNLFPALIELYLDPSSWKEKADLWYKLPNETQNKYKEFWNRAVQKNKDEEGRLGASEAKEWFKMSGLSEEMISRIWDSSSKGSDSVDVFGFVVALRYIAMAQNKEELAETEMLNAEKQLVPTIKYPEPVKEPPRYEVLPMEEWATWDIRNLFISLGANERELSSLVNSKLDGAGLKETNEKVLYKQLGVPYGIVKKYSRWVREFKPRVLSPMPVASPDPLSVDMKRVNCMPIPHWLVHDVCALFLHLGAEQDDLANVKSGRITGTALLLLSDDELKTELHLPIGTRKSYRQWLETRRSPLSLDNHVASCVSDESEAHGIISSLSEVGIMSLEDLLLAKFEKGKRGDVAKEAAMRYPGLVSEVDSI